MSDSNEDYDERAGYLNSQIIENESEYSQDEDFGFIGNRSKDYIFRDKSPNRLVSNPEIEFRNQDYINQLMVHEKMKESSGVSNEKEEQA